jgi:hypothetical protein
MVTEEALWGTAFADVVLEGVGELFLCLHTIHRTRELWCRRRTAPWWRRRRRPGCRSRRYPWRGLHCAGAH